MPVARELEKALKALDELYHEEKKAAPKKRQVSLAAVADLKKMEVVAVVRDKTGHVTHIELAGTGIYPTDEFIYNIRTDKSHVIVHYKETCYTLRIPGMPSLDTRNVASRYYYDVVETKWVTRLVLTAHDIQEGDLLIPSFARFSKLAF